MAKPSRLSLCPPRIGAPAGRLTSSFAYGTGGGTVSVEETVPRGKRPRVFVLVAAVIAGVVLVGGGIAAFVLKGGSDDDSLRPASSGSDKNTALREIPAGFLLHEQGGSINDESSAEWLVEPCSTGIAEEIRETDEWGRLDSRRVSFAGDYGQRHEQVALYDDEAAARQNLEGLRTRFERCADVTPSQRETSWQMEELPGHNGFGALNDHALGDSWMAIVFVQEANAIAAYAEYRPVEGFALRNSVSFSDAKKMAAKLKPGGSETADPSPATTPATGALREIPKGFLLHEKEKRASVNDDASAAWVTNPCGDEFIAEDGEADEWGRLDSRRLHVATDISRFEQVALYDDAAIAQQNMTALRERFTTCGQPRADGPVGEWIRGGRWTLEELPELGGFGAVASARHSNGTYPTGWAVIMVCKGNAIAMYAETLPSVEGFALQNSLSMSDAKKMAAKL